MNIVKASNFGRHGKFGPCYCKIRTFFWENFVPKNEQNWVCKSKLFLQLSFSWFFFCKARSDDSKSFRKGSPKFTSVPKLEALTVRLIVAYTKVLSTISFSLSRSTASKTHSFSTCSTRRKLNWNACTRPILAPPSWKWKRSCSSTGALPKPSNLSANKTSIGVELAKTPVVNTAMEATSLWTRPTRTTSLSPTTRASVTCSWPRSSSVWPARGTLRWGTCPSARARFSSTRPSIGFPMRRFLSSSIAPSAIPLI